jgi:hypothetical protein
MNFYFDNYSNFSAQHASSSGRTLAPTNYTHNFCPHKPCSSCFNPHHHVSDCLAYIQFFNSSCEQMNTNFSSLGIESDFNFYNPDRNNHPDFLWQAQAWEIVLPNFRNCIILNIRSSKTKSSIVHHMIPFLKNH